MVDLSQSATSDYESMGVIAYVYSFQNAKIGWDRFHNENSTWFATAVQSDNTASELLIEHFIHKDTHLSHCMPWHIPSE